MIGVAWSNNGVDMSEMGESLVRCIEVKRADSKGFRNKFHTSEIALSEGYMGAEE